MLYSLFYLLVVMSKQIMTLFSSYFFTIVLYICVADCTLDDYQFVSEIDGYLKLHRIPAKWQDARFKCYLEGGVLASPADANISAAMKDILTKEKRAGPNKVFTGIHATYSDGDFTTVTGIPLSQIDVEWDHGEPNGGKENCLTMLQSGEVADVHCDSEYPYICYKSTKKIDAHKCGPEYKYSDYKLDNRTGSCYKFHKEGRSWPNAFKTCMAEEAHLAIINSALESKVISELFNKYSHGDIPGNFHKDAASIGITLWQDYGDWFTIHGESLAEAGFDTFNAGEPNNADKREFCGSVWRTGLFNDHNCDRPLTFICEKTPFHLNHYKELDYQ